MVRLVPVHIRFVSFSVEVLFPSAARFRELKREGGRLPSAVAFGAALSVGAVRAGFRRARGLSDGSENRPLIHREKIVLASFVCSSVQRTLFSSRLTRGHTTL